MTLVVMIVLILFMLFCLWLILSNILAVKTSILMNKIFSRFNKEDK